MAASNLSLLSRSKAVSILPPLRQPGGGGGGGGGGVDMSAFGSTGGGGGSGAPSLSLGGGAGGGGGGAYQPRPNLNVTDPNPFAPQQPSVKGVGAAGGGGAAAPRLSLTGGAGSSAGASGGVDGGFQANPFAPTQPSSSSSSSSSGSTGGGGGRRPNLNATDPPPWAVPSSASSSSSSSSGGGGGARPPHALPSLVASGGDDDDNNERAHRGRRPNLNVTDPNPFAPDPKPPAGAAARLAPAPAIAAAVAAAGDGHRRQHVQPLNGRRPLGAPEPAAPAPAVAAAPAPMLAAAPAMGGSGLKLRFGGGGGGGGDAIAEGVEPEPSPAPAAHDDGAAAGGGGGGADDEVIPVLTDDGLVMPGDGEKPSSIHKLSLNEAAALNPHAFSATLSVPTDENDRRATTRGGGGGGGAGGGGGDDDGPLPVLTDDGLVDAVTKAPVEFGGGLKLPSGGSSSSGSNAADDPPRGGGRGLTLPGSRRLGDDGSAAAAAAVPPPLFSPPSLPLTVPESVVTPKAINLGADELIPVLTDEGLVTKAGARIDLDEMPARASVSVPFGLKLAIPAPAQPYRNVLSNTDPRRASQIMSNKRASMMSQAGGGGNKPTGMAGVFANLAAQHANTNTLAVPGSQSGGGAGGGMPPMMGGGLGAMKLKIDIKAEVNPNARKEGLAQEGNDGEWPEPPPDHDVGGAGGGTTGGVSNALAASLKSQAGGGGGGGGSHKDRYATFVVTKDNTFVSRGFKIDEHGVHMTPDRKAKELARKKNPLMNSTDAFDPDETMSDTVGMEISHSDLIQITVLGRGQNGNVYKSLHMTTFTLVALKTVNAMERSTRHQLVKELSTFCQINNPHLVRLLGAYFHEGEIFMALECMNAGSLKQWVEHYGPMREDGKDQGAVLKSFCRQMVLGVRHLHLHMQLHNDIKPDNVLLNKAGVVKMCDFGLAKQFDRNSDKCLQFLGTTVYLAPERITSQEFSYPSDIWSLGLTVLFCVLGRLPWEKDSDYWSLISQITKKSPSLPRDGAYSKELCDFIDACLMQDPAQRATADQLLKHPFLADVKGIAPIYQDTRAAMDELEEIMEVAVQKIMQEPKNFKELSAQLGLDESVVKDCWTRHKAARDAEEAARDASDNNKSRVRVQLSAGRRRNNNFMEPDTPSGRNGGGGDPQSSPPTPARSTSDVGTGAAASSPAAPGGPPGGGSSNSGSSASGSSGNGSSSNASGNSSAASSSAAGSPAPPPPPPVLGRPFSNAGEPSATSTPLNNNNNTGTAGGGTAAATRDRSVSAPSSKPLERSLSARRRANFRVNAGGVPGAIGSASSMMADGGGTGGSPSPIVTTNDGDLQVLDTTNEPHSATAVSASAAAAARLGANAGLGPLRNSPSPPVVVLNAAADRAAAAAAAAAAASGTGSPAPGHGYGHGRSTSMLNIPNASALGVGGGSPAAPGSAAAVAALNAAHKHKFKPVQKLGLMSPRDALAAADRVQLVAPSPRFSTKVTTLPPAAGAAGPPAGSAAAMAATATATAAGGGLNVGLGGSMLSQAAAAAAASSSSTAQRAQEKRREVGLARRRGNTDSGVGGVDGDGSRSRGNTGDAASISAAVAAGNALYGGGGVSPNSMSPAVTPGGPRSGNSAPNSGGGGGQHSGGGGAGAKQNPFVDIDPFSVLAAKKSSPGASPLPAGMGVGGGGGGGSSGNAGNMSSSSSSSPQPAAATALSAAGHTAALRQPTRPSIPKPGGGGVPLPLGGASSSSSSSNPSTPSLGPLSGGSSSASHKPGGSTSSSAGGNNGNGGGGGGGNNIFADPIFALAAGSSAAPPAGGPPPGNNAVSARTKKLMAAGAVRKNHRRSRSNPNLYDEALAATAAGGAAAAAAAAAGGASSASAAASAAAAIPHSAAPPQQQR